MNNLETLSRRLKFIERTALLSVFVFLLSYEGSLVPDIRDLDLLNRIIAAGRFSLQEDITHIPEPTQLPESTASIGNSEPAVIATDIPEKKYEVAGLHLEGPAILTYPDGVQQLLALSPMPDYQTREEVLINLSDWEKYPNLAPVSPTENPNQFVVECHAQNEVVPCDKAAFADLLSIGETWGINSQDWVVQGVKHPTRDQVGISRIFHPDGTFHYDTSSWNFDEGGSAIYLVTCFGEYDWRIGDYEMKTVIKLVPASEYKPDETTNSDLETVTKIAKLINDYQKRPERDRDLGAYLLQQEPDLTPEFVNVLNINTYPTDDKESAIQCIFWVDLLWQLFKGPHPLGGQQIIGPAGVIPRHWRTIDGEMRWMSASLTLQVGTILDINELDPWDTIVTYNDFNDPVGHAWVVVGVDGESVVLADGNPAGDAAIAMRELTGQEQLSAFFAGAAGLGVVPGL